MDSEEEDGHIVARSQNSIPRTSTPNGKRHRKRARMSNGVAHGQKGDDLLQQRVALPIWTGLCIRFVEFSFISTAVDQVEKPWSEKLQKMTLW
jgi:hypothetical protein